MNVSKATGHYLAICKEHNSEQDAVIRSMIEMKGHGYLAALTDLVGAALAGRVGMKADLALPDDGRPACCGMYLDMETRNIPEATQ